MSLKRLYKMFPAKEQLAEAVLRRRETKIVPRRDRRARGHAAGPSQCAAQRVRLPLRLVHRAGLPGLPVHQRVRGDEHGVRAGDLGRDRPEAGVRRVPRRPAPRGRAPPGRSPSNCSSSPTAQWWPPPCSIRPSRRVRLGGSAEILLENAVDSKRPRTNENGARSRSSVRCHQAPQPDHPIPAPGLDGSECNSEPLGDLDVGQTVEVGELERLPLGLAQLGECPACPIAIECVDRDVRRAEGNARRSRRSWSWRSRSDCSDRTRSTARRRAIVDGPATHTTAGRVETGCLAPELDEDLLSDLLGIGRRSRTTRSTMP